MFETDLEEDLDEEEEIETNTNQEEVEDLTIWEETSLDICRKVYKAENCLNGEYTINDIDNERKIRIKNQTASNSTNKSSVVSIPVVNTDSKTSKTEVCTVKESENDQDVSYNVNNSKIRDKHTEKERHLDIEKQIKAETKQVLKSCEGKYLKSEQLKKPKVSFAVDGEKKADSANNQMSIRKEIS